MFTQVDLSGKTVAGRYLLQRQIGSGRMSFVYGALDSAAGDALVAVKILNTAHPDETRRASFKRETDALKRLNHPNIVRLRESGWLDDPEAPYLVLDYLPHSLDDYLKSGSQLPVGSFDQHRVMRELASALAHAHSQNVIHRDIKPSNILLDANGHPCLTDFGISKLLDSLTIGETLAGYFSVGYASPEQRAQKPADFKSDIYSLGAVFYQMLSGQSPPPEGPTPIAVDNHIGGQPQIRAVLKRMLAEDPEEREYTGPALVAALDTITRQVEILPWQCLILTGTAIRNIRDAGYIPNYDFNRAAEVIRDNFGGESRREVYIQQDRNDPDTLRILGDSLRLICKPDRNALAIVAVHAPYQTELEQQKERALPYRAVWEPVPNSDSVSADAALPSLIEQLASFEKENTAARESQRSRRDFIERWQAALRRQEQRISEGGLPFEQVSDAGDCWHFTLSEPPPDDLNWYEDVALSATVQTRGQTRTQPVGNLVEIRGNLVVVAKEYRRSRRNEPSIPATGRLMLNRIEVSSAIDRQKKAIQSFLHGDNLNLANVIAETSGATHIPPLNLDYFQDWLSDDKKEAVSKAVSSNELFLIQGPPGTGKTAVIAEIVLQILRRNPDAHILLSSQSNVAVDHALSQIARAAGESPPDMIRLGRQEKISGDDWTIQGRSRALRQDVQDKCQGVLDDLLREERRARADADIANVAADSDDRNRGEVAVWIDEAKELIVDLRDYEQQQSDRNPSLMQALVTAGLEETQARLKDQFDALIGLLSLPIAYTGTNADEVLDHIIRAAAPPAANEGDFTGAGADLRKVQEIRSVILEWMQVAGTTKDMMKLIVEQSSIVAATCLYSGGSRMPDANFDWAIIDEAGRATVPEVLIPIAKSERVILVGDERQLSPMVDAEIAADGSTQASDDDPLDASLFQMLVAEAEKEDHWHLAGLRRQYRMNPAIGNLISHVFYDGLLEQGRSRDLSQTYSWLSRPVSWMSTSALPDREESRRGSSFVNHTEANLVCEWLQDFEEQCRLRGLQPVVGVISGYQAQVEQLTRSIDPENGDRWRNLRVEVATVDSFQGRECDVVVYSTVRSNPERRIEFLRDYRRINVALSRARDLLVIVGDDFMMRNAAVGMDENPFAAVLEHIRRHPGECAIVPAGQGG